MAEYYNVEADFMPLLEGMAQLPPFRERSLEQLRYGTDYSLFGDPEPVREVREVRIPVDGTDIAALLYLPEGEPTALMIFYHGGGWVMGNLESHDRGVRTMVNQTGIAALSIDYRMAPEHPFPVPFEDCRAALLWARDHCAELVGADLPLLVGGDSAGGNLAAVLALLARDGLIPRLAAQVLIYPNTDARQTADSYRRFGDGFGLTAATMAWFRDHYVRTPDDITDWRVSPLLASSLAGAAPAFVVIAGHDILADEGTAYAERLRIEGVPLVLRPWLGQIHGFVSMGRHILAARQAVSEAAAWLQLQTRVQAD